MKQGLAVASVLLASLGTVHAGGLYLPGAGAVSTSRAGASVAATDDGEALVLNPAGLAKTTGTTITLSAAIIDYAMKFQRSGTYDPVSDADYAYEGQAYAAVKDDAKPSLGIGGYQPIPVFTITSDLGGADPNLRVAFGLYAPNSYPFRKMCTEQTNGGCEPYEFNADPSVPPSPVRYDMVEQEATIFMPTVGASYRISTALDVGARFGVGLAHLKSTVVIWGTPGNQAEDVAKDALFAVDVKDNFVPGFGLGATYRPTPFLELGVNYSSALTLAAKGTAHADLGPSAGAANIDVEVGPSDPGSAKCEEGGTFEKQKVCVDLEVPATATLGARYKFLDAQGNERGDIELDLGWENWGSERASDFKVVVDGQLYFDGVPSVTLKDNYVPHGFQNTYNARLGGSWRFPVGTDLVIARAGIGYDTRAAKDGWIRADFDGAARTTMTVGAGYRASRFEINVGGGVVLEGTNTNDGTCNPISDDAAGCNLDGNEDPVEDRQGPDPINPLVNRSQQSQGPVNQGTFTSHYVMFMLGARTWF